MGFLNNLFKNKKERSPVKGKFPKTKKETRKSTEFLEALRQVILQAENMVSKSPKLEVIQKEATTVVEGFFYSNLITNFKNNLTGKNLEENKIAESELNSLEKEFDNLFNKCENNLKNGANKEQIDKIIYSEFKGKLRGISPGAYDLLIELENIIEFTSCEEVINKFKKEIKNFGKALKVGKLNKGLGLSFGIESDEGETYSKNSESINEIKDFDNFSLSLDGEWATLKDKEGHFFGEYFASNNDKYLVVFSDAQVDEDENMISGQVYLILDKKRILWRKNVPRPNGGFVNNEGKVAIIDWLAYKKEKLSGKLHLFDKNGKCVFEYSFNSNIGGQAISKEGNELIITTCFPENAIYLFNLETNKLVKKIKNNASNKPLVNFNFKEVYKSLMEGDKFNQEEYDKKVTNEQEKLEEENERIGQLKRKKIESLKYEDLVTLGSLYLGDFYGNDGQPEISLKYFTHALEIREKPQPYVLKSMGFCYEKIKNYKEAIKFYELALKQYPQYKKSVVVDHLEFCNLKLNNKLKTDWTAFIIEKREKERE